MELMIKEKCDDQGCVFSSKYPELMYGKEDAYGKNRELSMWIYNDADTSWRVSFLSCYKVSYETDATWRGRTVRMSRYR